MIFSRVQSASASGDPASATFGATPAEGNLLVVIAGERSGTTEANFTISGSGWTKRIGRDSELGDPNARRTLAVWSKVAGASEPTNIQVDNGTANTKYLLIQEFQSDEAVDWAFESQASADSGTGSTSPQTTGTTASVGSGDVLVIVAAIWRNTASSPGSIAWTNSLGNSSSHTGGSNEITIDSPFKQDAGGETYDSSVSWTGAGLECTAGILAFSADGAGGSLTLEISDDFSLADALTKDPSKALADAISLSEALSKLFGKVSSDSITLADSKSFLCGKVLSDSITLDDARALLLSKSFSDSFELADASTQALVLILEVSDSFSLSDAQTKSLLKTATEIIALDDLLTKTVGKSLADSIGLTEAVAKLVLKDFSDGLTLNDAAVTQLLGFVYQVILPLAANFAASNNTAKLEDSRNVAPVADSRTNGIMQ